MLPDDVLIGRRVNDGNHARGGEYPHVSRNRSLSRLVAPLCGLLVCVAVCLAAVPARAGADHRAFLEGLRQRGYFDMALVYLDQIEADPNLPADVKAVIDFERAITLIGLARSSNDPATQTKRLDAATAAMERFVKANPEHPLVARAQTERGNILLGKARVAILKSKSPGNEGQANALREDARKQIAEARKIFESARGEYEAKWKSFGPFVDSDDAQQRAARNEALNSLIQSRLHLAECTYRQAQTHPVGDPKRNELLSAAAELYKQIHSDYRSQVGGLYARLWMGKCYEEQAPRPVDGKPLTDAQVTQAREMLNIAEAIYSELLEHDAAGSRSAARMQDYAFWFKLIVRNHPALKDHQLVVDLATEWFKGKRGAQVQTTTALGVRWERAQAYEALADATDVPEGDRTRLLREALADAEFVNSFPSEFRDVSRVMIQRVKSALGRGEGDPESFDAANGLAQTLHNEIGAKKEAVAAAKTPEAKKKAQAELTAHLDETARILKLALALAGPGTNRSSLNAARYRLAYVEYQRDRLYDAAVLGTFVGRKFKNESPQIALDSAYLGMAAFYKLYDQADAATKQFALENLRETADFITAAFPESEQANESRMMLGRLYMQADDFKQAAEWFSKVPASSGQARQARLLAGRAFWDAYVTAQRLPEEQQPDAETMDKLRADAEKFLREGLDLAAKQLPADAESPEAVVAGKATLAQITNLDGNFKEAVTLLSGGPRPVTAAIAVKDGAARPKTGIQSAAFATLVHQQLLRAYIGSEQTDLAIAEMEKLVRIGGEGNTAVFVDLGRQITEELKATPEGPERNKRMTNLDAFLAKLSGMKQGQNFNSLVWIGETYFGLAQAAAEPKRSTYFDQAAKNYQAILDHAGEPGFLPSPESASGVRLRMAAVMASRGDYETAYDFARQVLKEMPRALNAQIATAEILRDWGQSGVAKAPEKLLLSIQGDRSGDVSVWGWGQIAQRLQRAIYAGRGTEEFQEMLRQARYEIPAIRRSYAKTRSDQEQFKKSLEQAQKELLAYVATTPQEEIGSEWWAKLEALYQGIQQDLGIAVPKNLEPAVIYESAPPEAEQSNVAAAVEKPIEQPATQTETATPAEEESGSMLPILFGLLLAGGVTGGVVFTMFRGKKRPPIRAAPERMPDMAFAPPAIKEKSAKPRRAKRVDRDAKSSSAGKTPSEGEAKPRKPTSRPRVTGEADKPRKKPAVPREGVAPKAKSRKEPPTNGDAAQTEAPKVVKPRMVKKPRRTKPQENE